MDIIERDQRIAELERHLATITQQIESMKSSKKKKSDRGPAKGARGSRTAGAVKEKKAQTGDKRRRTAAKRKDEELVELTFEQKKDLSERINNLTGERLNTVVSIIQSSMPNLDSVRGGLWEPETWI